MSSSDSARRGFMGLVGWLVVGFIAAFSGGIASVNAPSFYNELVQPSWAPPAGAFGPVWTILYILMSVAAWLVWRVSGWQHQAGALWLFLVQLVANGLWSWLFFAWHQGAWAFAEICVLWLLIVATLVAFWRVRPLAGVLMLPYLAWVSFAVVLCYHVWRANPQLLG